MKIQTFAMSVLACKPFLNETIKETMLQERSAVSNMQRIHTFISTIMCKYNIDITETGIAIGLAEGPYINHFTLFFFI